MSQRNNKIALQGFKTTKIDVSFYKNRGTRPLLLAMIDSFKEDKKYNCAAVNL